MPSDDAAKFSSTVSIVDKDPYSSKISLDLQSQGERNATDKDDYDPFQHRKVKYPVSDGRSLANLLKSSLGSGILAVPNAFRSSGYAVGIVGTAIIGYMCAHAAHIFVKTSHGASKELRVPSLGYAETCEAAFATGPKKLRRFSPFVRAFTDWAMALTYMGSCTVYTVLMTDQLKDLLVGFYPNLDVAPQLYTIVFLIPLVFLVQIKNLKYLAPFSALANCLMMVVFAICLYYIFDEFPSFSENPHNIRPTNDISQLPLFLTTIIFAMEGIGVVMPVENEMSKPQHFLGCPGILNISMTLIVFMYGALGIFGYMRYGDTVAASITLNLSHDAVPAILGKAFIIIAIFFTFLLAFYVTIDVIWRHFKKSLSPERHTLWQILIRLVCLFIIVTVAMLIPQLEQIIGLVGAIFFSSLGLIFPAIVETVFLWDRDLGKCNWILWKNVSIGLFGMIALVFGSIQSIRDML